jgi:hypothetical protein
MSPETIAPELIALYQPADSQERFAVQRIAHHQKMLQFCADIESAFNATGPGRVTPDAKTLALFRRYKSQTERMYRSAVKDFERIRSMRTA